MKSYIRHEFEDLIIKQPGEGKEGERRRRFTNAPTIPIENTNPSFRRFSGSVHACLCLLGGWRALTS